MKKMLFVLLVVAIAGFAGLRPASAQSYSAIVNVPFEFIVSGHVLPAGHYRIAPDPRDSTLLVITNTRDTAAAAFAVTGLAPNTAGEGAEARVAFKNVDGHMFLSQIFLPGTDAHEITVTKAEAERTLAKLNLAPVNVAAAAVK